MTTTPTLYVVTDSYRISLGDGLSVPNLDKTRPATHDELIAAMPRCGTCACRSEEAEWELYYCPVGGYVSASFGCTEHKVKP